MGAKGLLDAYLESTAEFSAMLQERTPGEIAYDNVVVAGLRRGLAITKALELAREKYPNESQNAEQPAGAERVTLGG